jgi:hypothetical protein
MPYLVSLQEFGMPWGFTHTFSKGERDALLSAKPGDPIKVRRGVAQLDKQGNMEFVLKSPGGNQSHAVEFQALCRQLLNPKDVELYASASKT